MANIDVQLWLNQRNPNGTTNIYVMCYANVRKDTGTAGGYWTYNSDPVNGDSIVIHKPGVYAIQIDDYALGGAGSQSGCTLNNTDFANVIQIVNDDNVLMRNFVGYNEIVSCSTVQFLNAGDVLRPQTDSCPVTPFHGQFFKLTKLDAEGSH